jgi:signal peptidase I
MSESLPEVDDASADLERASTGEAERTSLPAPVYEPSVSPDAGERLGAGAAPLAQPFQGGPRANQGRRGRRRFTGMIVVFVIAAALALGLRLFVVQTFYVPTGSMIPTLQVGDRMLVLKIGYTVTRGSILVFRQPPNDTSDFDHEDLVKRVIGLPGETISSRGNTVYIDGKPLAEPWLPAGTVLGKPIATEKIPPGDYFMMGDNRDQSEDSRYWGVLQGRLIVGKVLAVIWRGGGPVFHIQ